MNQQKENNPSNKLKDIIPDVIVYKEPDRTKFFSALSIPSYLRDWIVMRYSDKNNGKIDLPTVKQFVNSNIPRQNAWESIKGNIIKKGEPVRFLAKLRVSLDVKTGMALFSLPDLGFPKRKFEAVVSEKVIRDYGEDLLSTQESWGVIELVWDFMELANRKQEGVIILNDFKPFRPYRVDLNYYKDISKEFTIDEWLDVLLLAIDYNPSGFLNVQEKHTMVSRLIPFVEPRTNLIELAPKGTGKSYVFSQISKHGWLVSGGSITRAKMFYDLSSRTPGLVGRYDYVALDEIQSINFTDESEMRGALKGFMESGEYKVGNYSGVGDAGVILLGNIKNTSMSENSDMFKELPGVFHESALLDRFHGFIKGWNLPRMRENMKALGWALNTEYFTEILHLLRNDLNYRTIVDDVLEIPKGADTRDTEAIKRLASGYMKLLFPHVEKLESIDKDLFNKYCLLPAMNMRKTIRKQLNIFDSEYSPNLPDIRIRN